jgi:hypothetical protein
MLAAVSQRGMNGTCAPHANPGFENAGFDLAQGCPIMPLRSFSKQNVRQE